MVDAKGRDATDHGFPDHVGRVVETADSDLHDGHVHALAVEDVQGQQGQELKGREKKRRHNVWIPQ